MVAAPPTFALERNEQPVGAFLHEHGPSEYFASASGGGSATGGGGVPVTPGDCERFDRLERLRRKQSDLLELAELSRQRLLYVSVVSSFAVPKAAECVGASCCRLPFSLEELHQGQILIAAPWILRGSHSQPRLKTTNCAGDVTAKLMRVRQPIEGISP